MKELIHQYGAWIVFALVFLESIGLPLPGEAILVSAAIFAGTTQELSIALVVISAVLAAILGSTIGSERDIPGPLQAEQSGRGD
jgi:membrane protein DedA with SNARE-associated domain